MIWAELQPLIDAGESLRIEFKGERREPLNDRDLAAAVICLANAEGGQLLVGVEDDGRPGLRRWFAHGRCRASR